MFCQNYMLCHRQVIPKRYPSNGKKKQLFVPASSLSPPQSDAELRPAGPRTARRAPAAAPGQEFFDPLARRPRLAPIHPYLFALSNLEFFLCPWFWIWINSCVRHLSSKQMQRQAPLPVWLDPRPCPAPGRSATLSSTPWPWLPRCCGCTSGSGSGAGRTESH
jgi:hypothetical protein